jgi:hypothetical protein
MCLCWGACASLAAAAAYGGSGRLFVDGLGPMTVKLPDSNCGLSGASEVLCCEGVV